MKYFVVSAAGTLLSIGAEAKPLNDGPYVVYQQDNAVVLSVDGGEALKIPVSAQGKISVRFAEHKEWDFEVELKKELKLEASVLAEPEKLFVVSDIEGQFEGFRKLLIAGKVMDENYNWNFGKGHMVVCGDLFDRGLQVPECMWLLYKLEDAARMAGGYVHTILGNHDLMNLSGDLRYVQPKYFESAKLMGLEYRSLYGTDTELGRWLRSKNIMERIGEQLFLHAGISPAVTALGLSVTELNTLCRPYYGTKKSLVPESARAMFGDSSPFWYRGYFMEPKITEAELDASLKLFGVKRMIVGHTIMPGNIRFYIGGKVLGLDVDRHKGDHQAAVYAQGKWYKMNARGRQSELK